MRLSLVATAFSVISLAACSSAPTTPSAPVQANQATATTSDAAASAQTPARKKCASTGSHLCMDTPDPTISSGLAGGLTNSTSNAGGGGPH